MDSPVSFSSHAMRIGYERSVRVFNLMEIGDPAAFLGVTVLKE